MPLLKGERPAGWRDSIYYHYYEDPSVHQVPKHNGIRTDRYKLMHFYEFDEWEFYDLEKDPDELTNLYNDPEAADQIALMKTKLEALRANYDDKTVTGPNPAEWQKTHRTKQFRVPRSL